MVIQNVKNIETCCQIRQKILSMIKYIPLIENMANYQKQEENSQYHKQCEYKSNLRHKQHNIVI